MGRRILLTLIVLLAGLPAAPASGAESWRGRPTLISGTSRMDRGEWIYTDFVYDDYGADTGPTWGQPNVVSLASTEGDFRYPAGKAFKDNAADIVEVRARAAGNDLQVRVLLQTITTASTPAIWVQAGDFTNVFTNKNADIDTARTDGPTPYRLTGLDVRHPNKPIKDKLCGRLSKVSALTIDVGRAGLSNSPKLVLKTDRTVKITFVRHGVVVGSATVGTDS